MIGGGNLVRIFSITGATPTIAKDAVPLFETQLIEKNSLTGHPNKHDVVINVDNLTNTPAFAKFLDTYLTAESTAEATTVNLEDGAVYSTATSGGTDPSLFAVVYFGLDSGYRQVFMGPVKVSGDTGNESTQANNPTRRVCEITFVKATKAITLPSKTTANTATDTFYPTTHVTLPEATPSVMPAVATVAVDKSCVEVWLPKGSKNI